MGSFMSAHCSLTIFCSPVAVIAVEDMASKVRAGFEGLKLLPKEEQIWMRLLGLPFLAVGEADTTMACKLFSPFWKAARNK